MASCIFRQVQLPLLPEHAGAQSSVSQNLTSVFQLSQMTAGCEGGIYPTAGNGPTVLTCSVLRCGLRGHTVGVDGHSDVTL